MPEITPVKRIEHPHTNEIPSSLPFFPYHDSINNETLPYLQASAHTVDQPELIEPEKVTPPSSYFDLASQMIESILIISEKHKMTIQDVTNSAELTLERQHRTRQIKAEKEGEFITTSHWCDFFRQLATTLAAAFSVGIGGLMITNHPSSPQHLLGGSAMIASGVTSLLGNLLSGSNTAPEVGNALTLLSSGFGLIGGTAYLQLSNVTLFESAGKILLAATSIVENGSRLGGHYSHFQIEEIRGEQAILEEMMKRTSLLIDGGMTHLEDINHSTCQYFKTFSQGSRQIERAKEAIIANILSASPA